MTCRPDDLRSPPNRQVLDVLTEQEVWFQIRMERMLDLVEDPAVFDMVLELLRTPSSGPSDSFGEVKRSFPSMVSCGLP